MTNVSRREMLIGTGSMIAAGVVGPARRAKGAVEATVKDKKVISWQPSLYHGWPTIARCKNGTLVVVCSGGRETHVCPFGRVEFMTSKDDGKTWGWPRVLMDSAIDDRDAGVLETAKGSLLVTSFTSLAYESRLTRALQAKPGQKGRWPEEKIKRWLAAHTRLTDEQRHEQLGSWIVRSTDGGRTWSARYRCQVNSPHGPIQLSDGRLLYAGKELWHGKGRIGVCESRDDGLTWRWLAEIPTRKGDDHKNYHELHAVETAGGRLITQIRNHNKANKGETLQSESNDGGKTWSEPHSIGVWGLPSHLLRLIDGRLLMTYGHRRKPYGNQARVSNDNGKTWSDAMIVSGDGKGGDLGYPSSAQLKDGSLVTVWYEKMAGSDKAVLRQARWTLKG